MPEGWVLPFEGLALALALAFSATLLWLGASIGASRRTSTAAWWHAASLAPPALVAAGLWWPAQFLPAAGTIFGGPVLPAALAIGLATGVRAASAMASRGTTAGFTIAAVASWSVSACHAAVVSPALFRGGDGWWAPTMAGIAITLLTGALVALHLEREDRTAERRLRVGAAIVAAGALTLVSAQATAAREWEPDAVGWGYLPPVVGLALLAAALRGAWTRREREEAEPRSASRSAAAIDVLTKLPTRASFEDQLAAQVAKADAAKSRLALLFIDLDGFKPVNDTFGHSTGDLVLKEVGERLRATSRAIDVLTRIGGDEFVLMMAGDPTQEAAAQVARRLIDDISRPYDIGDREVVISCSIGIVIYPDSGAHTKLIARADAAMYEAKRSGGGCHCFYTPSMDEDLRDKFDLVSDLRQAIENKQMELFYQPKIDARSGKISAAEALLRWKHPKRGMVPPSVFIPLAERFGLIGALGKWVIDDACRQAQRWREHGLRMRLAINLSALQMRQDDIVQSIVGALERHRIHPSLLTCEITESVAMEDTKATQRTFMLLGEAGIHLSIDDFGTGYSSLSYLRRLPAEEIKIDRSFVMDIENSQDARSVVDAVIKLAHALSLRVVAEGVENQRQQEILAQMGCDEMQGYLFAKPMSARALLLWAIDDRPETTAFRASLFGDTVSVESAR
jgi:diguanylate cyclase (GGDEF)-like protein